MLFSSSVKAGRMLRLLGWINLSFTAVIGAAILIPTLAHDAPISASTAAILAAALVVAIGYLVVGGALKSGKAWAKPVGVILTLLGLLNVPIGTVIGVIALIYLAKCWNEPATAA
jgi:hypothetical protein